MASALLALGAGAVGVARADVTTVAVDDLRTGWDAVEPGLAPSTVESAAFGQLFSTPVDGQVYAHPLVIDGTVVAATENNHVYGLDGVTGAQRWDRSLGPAWPSATVGCGDLAPTIGVTSTPVYDPATDSVYALAKVNDGGSAKVPHWWMHALDPVTGAERPNFPVMIGGAPTNDPTRPFNALTAMQRPGLLLLDGVVYAGFASHCDYAPFVGYVAGVSTSGRQTTLWATESGNANAEGGIWQSGGGLVSDGPGQILFATGNGISPAKGPGKTPPSTLAESVVRLQVGGDGSLAATDFFSPFDNAKLDQDDADLGSGAPLAIPDGYGSPLHPHLLVQVGKDGHVRLLDRDDLGGMGQGPNGTDAVLDSAGPYSGVWGKPAFFGTPQGGYVYTVAANGYLRAFKLSARPDGSVALASIGTSPDVLGYTSGSPVVTSTGTDPSTALIWVSYAAAANGSQGQVRAYRAMPDADGQLKQVFSAPIGTAAKFTSVATDGGRVYVGTRDGRVFGFGAPTSAALGATATDLGSAPVGGSSVATVRLTASRDVSITGATAVAPFSIDPSALGLPRALVKGDALDVPVTFRPTTTGQSDGTLELTTAAGETVRIGVHGLGTRTGLGALPAKLAFTDVPTGTLSRQTVNVVNTGTAPVTIQAVTVPTDPAITVAPESLPVVGQQLAPQASVPVALTFTPGAAGSLSDALTVTSDAGSVTVPISATAVDGAPHLELPASLDFGDVPVGLSSTLSFPVENTGNIALTITKAKAPAGVFTTTEPMSENFTIPPGETAYQTVTFAPTAIGQAGGPAFFYLLTGNDGRGEQKVMLTGNGIDDPIAAAAVRVGAGKGTWIGVGQALRPQYVIAGGRCQDYTNGIICWSPGTGAYVVQGLIAQAYLAAGGPAGPLGFPTTDEGTTADGGGRYNHFSGVGGASIYWTPATGAHSVQGAIRDRWIAQGWERGPLGYPVTDEVATTDGRGRYNDFSGVGGASIYWTPQTGAHSVQGLVRDRWVASGGALGQLGYPVTDETATPDRVGRYNHFSGSGGASIYWTPATGAHSVQGAIRDRWAAQGWERGPLGYPVTDEQGAPDRVGRMNHFSGVGGASIYWTPATGAHSVQGEIRKRWAAQGWERGPLGYPVTDEQGAPDRVGRYNHFSGSGGASIYWTPQTGAHSVQGEIRNRWAAQGWELGRLGYPTSDEYGVPEGQRSDFQRGALVWEPRIRQVTLR
ncbi:choice-of-anchor D domain-containing protein [Modestobacter sp. L9-4]|uniref:choice-of-anchor D domain-containing protein n=1 Tax=Modestobacter sp. L9-4 TaxID=2851567 RepID=UPI001C793501|nr:choice-of-anchor D domain-containing protein [Modestobacter sp. L9-4]QXG74425.1 choice-of-anchor D domain-containing protein [Modestobacter sp. L9-4]